MQLTNAQLWDRYKKYLCACPSLGLAVDISRMSFSDDFFAQIQPAMTKAFEAMDKVEAGEVMNADEGRQVGHYWLRNSARAPAQLRGEIDAAIAGVKEFAGQVHSGAILAANGKKFVKLLVVGIGGSALGPEFVADALVSPRDKMDVFFFDNTDPDGMVRALNQIGRDLARTLTVVISKSGGTKETRNGMLIAKAAYEAEKLEFAKHAVAVTGMETKSELFNTATREAWLKIFPMWDWVGGRTSETSAVGLLPAALQGIDIDAFLRGAADTDDITRLNNTMTNPSALLAAMWYHAGSGKGAKDMVVLPYKDRLALFSKYLQQLIMESLGKEKDRAGNVVHQGIAVYGNKGSTDQHAYVQQLRDGVNNFFATFIEVLHDDAHLRSRTFPSAAATQQVETDTTAGDYLHGFFQGTRTALYSNDRESITITVDTVAPRTIGVLIALYERAVGLYAELININAYHQPGVEAGKKAATAVIEIQRKVIAHLRTGAKGTAEEIAAAIGQQDAVETVHLTLRHIAANPAHKITASRPRSGNPWDAVYAVAT